MSRCSGCGQNLAPNSRFCALCGKAAAPVAPTLHGAQTTGQYAAPPSGDTGRKKVALAAGGGAVAAAIILFLGLRASGLLGAKPTAAPVAGVLSAPQTQAAPAPLLAAPQTQVSPPPQTPVLTAPAQAGNPMPDDVAKWLRWLKWMEGRRTTLKNQSDAAAVIIIGEMMKAPLQEMMKEPDDIKEENMISKPALQKMAKMAVDWNEFTRDFQAGPQPPYWAAGTPNLPQACAPVAGAYNQMLTNIVQQQAQLQQILQQASESAGKSGGQATPDVQNALTQLYGQNNNKGMSQTVDATISSADGALNALRSRYTSVPSDIDRGQLDIRDQGTVNVPSAPTMPTF